MADYPVLHGIVLSSMPVGEYDRRLSILTKERGRISAFAKGAQKPKSALVAAAQPFVTGAFTVIEGRSSNTMIRAEVNDYFTELRSDLAKTCYGLYFCELAEFATEEFIDESETLQLLYAALRALSKGIPEPGLARAVYEIKITYTRGEGPQVNECVRCHDRKGPFVFHVPSGGCLCAGCAGELFSEEGRKAYELRTQAVVSGYFNLDESTWYALRVIASTQPSRLFSFSVSENVLAELQSVAAAWYAEHVDHTFRSAEMLQTLQDTTVFEDITGKPPV